MAEVEFQDKTLAEELAEAENELHAWATGARSNINLAMSFENDPADRVVTLTRADDADSASLRLARAKVEALRLLSERTDVAP